MFLGLNVVSYSHSEHRAMALGMHLAAAEMIQ